jgi:hypothetical protein
MMMNNVCIFMSEKILIVFSGTTRRVVPAVICLHGYAARLTVSPSFDSISAPVGQTRAHFPHPVHFERSTAGASKPFCVSAPKGQTRTAGQRWFCGHRSWITFKTMVSSSSICCHLPAKAPETSAPMRAPYTVLTYGLRVKGQEPVEHPMKR